MNFEEDRQPKQRVEALESNNATDEQSTWDQNITSLKVSDRIKLLIIGGNDGTYSSRSEADQAVVTALVNKGMSFNEIKVIFEKYEIGAKYREHSSPDAYPAPFTRMTKISIILK